MKTPDKEIKQWLNNKIGYLTEKDVDLVCDYIAKKMVYSFNQRYVTNSTGDINYGIERFTISENDILDYRNTVTKEQLQTELQNAIDAEDYNLAAEIRDNIKEM